MAHELTAGGSAIWHPHMAPEVLPHGTPIARTNTTHERTNATNARFQDQGITPHLLNAAGAVDKQDLLASMYEYRSSDLDFALFLSSVDRGTVLREKHAPMHRCTAASVAFRHELQRLEAQVSPDLVRAAELGVNRRQIGRGGRVTRTPAVLAAMDEIRRERGRAA